MKALFFVLLLAVGFASASPSPAPNDLKCGACKTMIKYVDDWLKSGAGHKEIEILIHQFCKMVGPKFEPVCDKILEMEIQQLIDWVTHFTPEEVCAKIGLCPKTDNTDGCSVCKTVIGFIDDWISTGAGKQELTILIEQLCKLFPQYKQVCEQLIEMEIDQLIAWIKSYSPEKVCQLMHLCPKNDLPNDTCGICKRVIGFIDDWLESGAGKAEIKVLIEALCAYMGPEYKQICTMILGMEIEQLIAWIESYSPEQVCQLMHLCPKNEEINDGCGVCKTVIKFIEDWIKSGTGKQELKILIQQLCKLFPQYKEVCKQLIEMEIDQLIEWITHYKPEQVCQLMHLCPKNEEPVANDKCATCKLVISLVEHWLFEQKTVKEIEALINKLCSMLGPSYASICNSILDLGLEKVIHWIETAETPEVVCRQLKQCAPTADGVSINKCGICKIVYNILAEFLTNPRSEQEIITFLDKACDLFPKYQAVCDELIAFGVMELAELVKQYDDVTVCKMIHLCA